MSDVQLTIPFHKIGDRLIEGCLTSEAMDSQGDIVTYSSSRAALGALQGRGGIPLRQMHQPIAIGKGIKLSYDDAGKKVYLRAMISRSAAGNDAMIAINEGVLRSYSIGGKCLDSQMEKYADEEGLTQQRRRVTKWTCSEVSLVDAGANPDTGFALVKMNGTGQLVATDIIGGSAPFHKVAQPRSWGRDGIELANPTLEKSEDFAPFPERILWGTRAAVPPTSQPIEKVEIADGEREVTLLKIADADELRKIAGAAVPISGDLAIEFAAYPQAAQDYARRLAEWFMRDRRGPKPQKPSPSEVSTTLIQNIERRVLQAVRDLEPKGVA